MGGVSKKGLAALIREKAGVKLTSFIMIILLIVNFENTLAAFSGIAVSASIFGVPPFISVPVAAFLLWGLVWKGSYKAWRTYF
jgi:Mn2+/Fe2+ NRAMP family transporter